MADERTRIEELEARLARAEARLAEKDKALADSRKALAEKDEALAEKDGVIAGSRKALAEKDGVIEDSRKALGEKDETILLLRHEIEKLCRQIYGRSSERIDTKQLLLAFAEARPEEEPPLPDYVDKAKDEETEESKSKPSRRNGRGPLSPELPRERIELEPTEEDRICDCGCERVRFGEDISEVLEYVPASLKVLQYVRPKLRCESCDDSIRRVAPPEIPIIKGRPGPGLLAEVIVRKYGEHLPLARQATIFRRHGQSISRQTLNDWIKDSHFYLKGIAEAVADEVRAAPVIQTDETGIRVRDPTLRPKIRKGRIWCWCGPPGAIRYVATRTKEGHWAEDFLGGYEGYIQADAYSGFDRLFRDGSRTEVGCWAHARRKIFEARESDMTRAGALLVGIQKLFRVEKIATRQALDPDQRREARQRTSAPVLAAFFRYAHELQKTLRPNSPLRKAVNYAINQEAALTVYLSDGRLCIDNNRSERSLRAVAVGRKNWMFAGSQDGAERAATLYTLVQSARELGLNPWLYLRDVLSRVAVTPNAELTPRAWKAARDGAASAG